MRDNRTVQHHPFNRIYLKKKYAKLIYLKIEERKNKTVILMLHIALIFVESVVDIESV